MEILWSQRVDGASGNAISLKGFEDVRVCSRASPYGLKTHRSGGNAIRSLTIKVERASREMKASRRGFGLCVDVCWKCSGSKSERTHKIRLSVVSRQSSVAPSS